MTGILSTWLFKLGMTPSQRGRRRSSRPAARHLGLRIEVLENRLLLSHQPGDHIHPVLKIVLDGQNVTIPEGIGITSTRHYSPHTHDTTGTLHVGEGPVSGIDPPGSQPRFTTLKDFFDVWRTTNVGQPTNNPYAVFSSTQILDKRVDANSTLRMTVNGQPNTQFENYSPHDQDQVVITYERTAPPPPPPTHTVLALAVNVSDVSEAAGTRAVLATVSHSGVSPTPITVALTSSRPSDVPSITTVTIPAGAERVTVPLDVLDNTQVDGTRAVTLTATAAGHTSATATFNVLDNEGLRGLFLSQAAYTGIEGGSGVRLTVVRGSQDANTSATVIYVTNDGTAKAGTDYTATSGTLTLAAGELSKSITITLTDDALAKAGRTFTFSLSSIGSAFPLLTPSRATVTILDNDLPAIADSDRPASVSAAADIFPHSRELYTNFVNTAYQKYLKRSADPGGLNGWVEGMLARRVTDELLESGFIGSPEYIQQNGGRGRGWIVGMYRDLLGRTPAESEVNGWLQALSNGTTEPQVAFGFAASAEREGQRVRENYRVYLERTPSQPEVDSYVAEFVAGRLTNEDVIARFIGSPEYYSSPQRGQGNRAVWIARAYEQVLFRYPSRAEVEGWVNNLR